VRFLRLHGLVSTLIELAGFGLVTYAAYSWNEIVGFAVAGVFLLAVGFAASAEGL
jgi:hypothetical protein